MLILINFQRKGRILSSKEYLYKWACIEEHLGLLTRLLFMRFVYTKRDLTGPARIPAAWQLLRVGGSFKWNRMRQ